MNMEGSLALNVLAMIYMLILFFNLGHNLKQSVLNRLYVFIILAVFMFLALDSCYTFFYGKTGVPYSVLLLIVKSLYLFVNCLIIWLWARYIDIMIYENAYKEMWHPIVYGIFFSINALMLLFNLFIPILFEISTMGTFIVHLIPMWIFTIMNYLSVALVTWNVWRNRTKIKHSLFLPLLIFPLPPFLAEIVQLFTRYISLTCAYSISALLVFQVAQDHAIYADELTGLSNRRLMNEYLNKWFTESNGSLICGIMIDLDGLKQINDQYGHQAGDAAIKHMAQIMVTLNRKDILKIRYGGDEFILLWRSEEEDDLEQVKQSLMDQKDKMNLSFSEQEKIEFSAGVYQCLDCDVMTPTEFLKQLDKRMYHQKYENKRKKQNP